MTDRIISEHGIDVLDAIVEDGCPIYWDAIRKGQYDCAEMLLDYAKNEGIAVIFQTEGEDLLLWAIESDAYESVRFILDKLTEKYACVEETSDLLAKHLPVIGEKRPDVLADLLRNDKFTIEYASFRMPKVLFDNNSKFAKTMITRTIPDNWEAMDGEQGKGLWIEHWEEEGHSIGSTTDPQITVTAKVFCISRSIPRKPNAWQSFLRRRRNITELTQHLCEYLRNLSLSVEVFESETLLNFIDHWFRVYRFDYQTCIILDGIATLALTIIFMTMKSPSETGDSSSTIEEE